MKIKRNIILGCIMMITMSLLSLSFTSKKNIVTIDENIYLDAKFRPLIKELHQFKDTISNYSQLKRDYDELVASINEEYRLLALAMTKGRIVQKINKKKLKKRYKENEKRIKDLFDKADLLYGKIGKAVDKASSKPKYTATFGATDNKKINFPKLLEWINKIWEQYQSFACMRGKTFYEENFWWTSSEIITNKTSINWDHVISGNCTNLLKKRALEESKISEKETSKKKK